MNRREFVLTSAVVMGTTAETAAQNVILSASAGEVLEPARLKPADVEAIVNAEPKFPQRPPASESRVSQKLTRHVRELLDGWPWRPFHFTHGISGYEAYFTHGDELTYALTLCLPCLPSQLAKEVTDFLGRRVAESPPYALAGLEARRGRARERHDVPDSLRLPGPFTADSLFGVYAFWLVERLCPGTIKLDDHWPALSERVQPLLKNEYRFDVKKSHGNDEAERLNGDVAGLIGFVRLARRKRDEEAIHAGLTRLRQVLELRVNLERVNPRILEPTRSSSAHLHAAKPARYCGLVPEIGLALTRHAGGIGKQRLAPFRAARPGWWLAAGDRLIGGENYTSPPHLSRALFAGAVFVEELPPRLEWLDVPWCAADLYFLEKAAWCLMRG